MQGNEMPEDKTTKLTGCFPWHIAREGDFAAPCLLKAACMLQSTGAGFVKGMSGPCQGTLSKTPEGPDDAGIPQFEKPHQAGQESIAANDHLHGLDAHRVAVSWQMQLKRLYCHVYAAAPLQPHGCPQQGVHLPHSVPEWVTNGVKV